MRHWGEGLVSIFRNITSKRSLVYLARIASTASISHCGRGIWGRAGLDSAGATLAPGVVDTFKGDSDLGLEATGVEGFSVGGVELEWLVPLTFTL